MAAAAGMLLLARPSMAAVTSGPVVSAQEQTGINPGPEAAAIEGAAAVPQQDSVIVSQAPPGDEGTILSPVVVAGNGAAQGQTEPQGSAGAAQPGTPAQEHAAAQQEAAASSSPVIQQGASPSGENGQAAPLYPAGEGPAGVLQPAADGNGQQESQTAADGTGQQAAGGRQVDPSRPMVALTFDDGPQPSVGNRIMDCLAQYGGKATFFMVGERVPAHADEVRRMVAEGHEVANHTMNHKYLQKLGAAEIQSQVTSCNDVIESVCGVRPVLMRLPGGNHNATVLANTNMPMIQWNIDTLDWKTRNAQNTVSVVLGQVKDGDIVLMHELYGQSGDAALAIIPELVNRGYQLVTVSEMAAAKGQTLQAGKLYSSFH